MSRLTKEEEKAVSRIVNTSVDDAKNSLQFKMPKDGKGDKKTLTILKSALVLEEAGRNRKSLLTAIRRVIKAQEKALATESSSAGDTQPVVSERVAHPSVFAPHPKLEAIPMLDEVLTFAAERKNHDVAESISEELIAMDTDVERHNVHEPVKVVPATDDAEEGINWFIVDGRHRWASSLRIGAEELPFVEVSESEIDPIIEGSVMCRRTWTQGQKAFLAVGRYPHLKSGKRGRPPKNGQYCLFNTQQGAKAMTREDVAKASGVSLPTLRDAIEFHNELDKHREKRPDAVRDAEMLLWTGVSLGAAKNALGGIVTTRGSDRRPSSAITAGKAFKSLASRCAKFSEWPKKDLIIFQEDAEEFWSAVDGDLAEFLIAVKNKDTKTVERIIADSGKPNKKTTKTK